MTVLEQGISMSRFARMIPTGQHGLYDYVQCALLYVEDGYELG